MKRRFFYYFNLLILLSFCIRPQFLASQPLSQIYPKNNFTFHSDSAYFAWNSVNDAFYYELNIAEDPLFTINNSVYRVSDLRNDTSIKNLTSCKKYYWKVKTIAQSGLYTSAVKTFNIFTPRCISGLELWLSADSGVVSDGFGNISDWIDRSGKHNNAIQTTAANQPLLYKDISNTTNKCSFIKLDGIDDYMNLDHSLGIASFFLAFNWGTSAINYPGYNSILSTKVYTSKGIVFMGSQGTSNYYDDGTSNTFSSGEVQFNGNTTLNMSPISDFKLCSAVKSSSTALSNFYISRYLNDATSFWNGNIGDMIIYNVPLTTNEKAKVESYVYDKYAPPVNLGADKTICSFPFVLRAKKDYLKSYSWQDGSTDDSLVINAPGTYYLTTINCFGVTSSDTVIINNDISDYTASLPNDTTLCNGNTLFLYGGPNHLSYLWSNGSTHNNIIVSTPGKYYVTMMNCLNNTSTDTIIVNYKQSPVFSFGNDTTICYNSNFLLQSIYSASLTYTFTWSNGASTPSITPNHSGQYWLNVTNNYFCSHADTINIKIDSSLVMASLGPDRFFCSGNAIALISGLSPSLTYSWNTGATTSSLIVTNSGQYSVIVTNTNSCVAKDTITVNIKGQAPTPNFTAGIGCLNSQTYFTNSSVATGTATITNYDWNFGDPPLSSSTSTLTNPTHTYTNTGTYTVSLNVTTDEGCSQSITKTVQVYPKPTVNFTSGLSCQNNTTSFTNLSTSVSGYSITSYNWNFGDPGPANTSTVTSPIHTFTNSANYTIKLVATNNVGCKDSLTNIIAVKSQVKADFTYSPPCVNSLVLFQDNSIAPLPASQFTRTWIFSAGTTTPTGLTAPKTFTSSGVYSVTLTVAGNSGSNLCSSSITKLITIFEPPTADFTIPSFCAKDTVSVINTSTAQSGVIASYSWKVNGNSFSSAPNPTITATAAGTYSVRLTVSNSYTCKDSTTRTFTVFPLPNIDFTTNPATYYYLNDPVTFTPTYTNASTYFWNIIGVTTSTLQSTTATFSTAGTYTAFLNSQDQNGCKNSKTKIIQVSKRYLDLAILNVTTEKDNAGFMTVKADIANYGTVPVSSFDIHYRISDAGNIKETWTGTFNPNSFYQYTFVSRSIAQKDNPNNITCIEIEKVNGVVDENTSNNALCNSLNYDDVSVSNPIPNPAEGDITLPVILNKDSEFSISIYNSNGQLVLDETTYEGSTGLNFITLPTSSYARGCYVIKTQINSKLFIKKFIKISNE